MDMPKDENWIASQDLTAPLKWRKSRHVVTTEDLFHENVPDDWVDRVFAIMALTPQHTYQVLTKRADRMREYVLGLNCDGARRFNCARHVEEYSRQCRWFGDPAGGVEPEDERLAMIEKDPDWPLPNVWLGVSTEDQTRADQRIPDLLATPAAVRFVSVEPMLGPVDLERWLSIHWQCSYCRGYFGRKYTKRCPDCGNYDGMTGSHRFNGRNRRSDTIFPSQSGQGIDWVICGGESGGSARPMHPDWARSLRDQCAAAGVAFFFKQVGTWTAWQETGSPPYWRNSFTGHEEDRHGLFPSDWDADPNWDDGLTYVDEGRHVAFNRIGKKAAGRLLDGVQHDGRPETKGET